MAEEFALFGRDLFGDAVKRTPKGLVARRFTVPPFTVLDTKSGDWQDRKRAWKSLGIKGELGRDAATYNTTDWLHENGGAQFDTGTSIFDPVLCELAYAWFCPPGGQVVDPFAGGSVRGIVAGSLGFKYWGCDLSGDQIAANEAQAGAMEALTRPVWVVGDSMDRLAEAPPADFVFSCPPYGDLEVYSDDPRDLSTMEWHTFEAAYKRIILRCVQKMRDNSFACFVVGDFRDPTGCYRNFVGKTVEGFVNAGAKLYNEAILATSVGSACMRVTKQFDTSRKMAKTHQNVLVFVKGDPRVAASRCVTKI